MKSGFFKVYHFDSKQSPVKGQIYMLGGFMSPLAYFKPTIKKLQRRGYNVVFFRFLTKPIIGLTADSLKQVVKDAVYATRKVETKRTDKTQTIIVGNSMGSVFAWHIAASLPNAKKIVANTGYALISKLTFEDRVGRHWLHRLEKEGLDQAAFRRQIIDSEPLTAISKLKDRKILLFMNERDNVISYEQAKLFTDAFKKHNLEYTFVKSNGSRHGITLIRNLHSKQFLDFVES